MEVLGLEHIDITVNDIERFTAFYTCVLEALGFRRFDHPAQHVSWSNGHFSITLRAAAPEFAEAEFSRYRVGLHHFAFKLKERGHVDALHRLLVDNGLSVLDPPADYPQYGAGYYAVFFADPDGMKLEAVHFPWGYWKRVQTEGYDPRARYELIRRTPTDGLR